VNLPRRRNRETGKGNVADKPKIGVRRGGWKKKKKRGELLPTFKETASGARLELNRQRLGEANFEGWWSVNAPRTVDRGCDGTEKKKVYVVF